MATNAKDVAPVASWRETARERLKRYKEELSQELANLEATQRQAAEGEDQSAFYPPNRGWYWGVLLIYIALQYALGKSAIGWTSLSPEVYGISVNVGIFVILLQGLHLVFSIAQVGVDDLAGIDFFGRPLYLPTSGLYLVPWGILAITKASRNYKDVRFPGPPDRIFRISSEQQKDRPEGDAPPEGMVRAIYVTTGEPQLSEDELKARDEGKTSPLDQQLNIEVAYFVRYRPNQEYGGIFRIMRNLAARGGNVDERIRDLMREQSERDIKGIITSQTTATTIQNWDLVNEVFWLRIQIAVLALGIEVPAKGTGLDDINPSHETNEEQQEVARAEFRRMQTIIAANAESEKRTREGAGTANAERLLLEGFAAGYKKIMDDTGVGGDAVVASETAKKALSDRADTIVLGSGGVSDLFGILKAGQKVLGAPGSPRSSGTEQGGS